MKLELIAVEFNIKTKELLFDFKFNKNKFFSIILNQNNLNIENFKKIFYEKKKHYELDISVTYEISLLNKISSLIAFFKKYVF